MRALVEESCASSAGSAEVSSGTMRFASALPSSTPHWSKLLTPQMRPLNEHLVLVERDDRAERARIELGGEDRARRRVAAERPVRDLVGRDAVGDDLLGGLPERERLGLGEEVRHQQVVLVGHLVVRLREAEKVGRDEHRPLVNELEVRVLAVRPGGPPHDGAGLRTHRLPVAGDGLAVALHVELLEVRRQQREVLGVRQHRVRLRIEELAVPQAEQSQQHRHVAGEVGGAEVLVHRAEAREQLGEAVGADRDHETEPDRGVHRVAATDPVPELEHVLGVDAELRDLLRIGRDGDEVCGDRALVTAEPVDQPRARGLGVARVSCVVNVFELTMTSVSAGSRSFVASQTSVPSTLETKRTVTVARAVVLEGFVRHVGAQVGAADADVDDVADPLPVCRPLAAAYPVENAASGRGRRARPPRRRSVDLDAYARAGAHAVCSTARSSSC
jgi:hypothetical protein